MIRRTTARFSGGTWAYAAMTWKSVATIQKCYQQPDESTMLSVVLGGAALREKQA